MEELSSKINLDEIDLAILRELQHNNRISNSELARRINLSQPATHTRIKRLEKQGVIRQHASLLDRDKLGLDMICFIQIRLKEHTEATLGRFQKAIQPMPEVLECYHLTGEFDFLLKVVLKNRRALGEFHKTEGMTMPDISQISTSVVLFEIKSTTALPLPDN